ncbi:hypothetical protein DMN91_006574 [Ooceraea biroi]|uniref:Uncharacterized protein n=1 Tax=Ooceraea biroi TaxID=2015173 RepID=A0A3L8DPN7_OOCBI|nr:hypothetical protein DMN91_006574 [Ooceraea biroi]
MRVDRKRGIGATSSASKLNGIFHAALLEHEFQRADYLDSPRKCLESRAQVIVFCYNIAESVLEDEPREGRARRSILLSCREYLANYQESCGTPRTEYSYAALITVMAQATARSLWALMYIFVNVAPVIQMFSFVLRFVLDKTINIRRTEGVQQTIIKSAILLVQLLSVYICLVFILGFLVLPIVQMAVGIATKFAMRD